MKRTTTPSVISRVNFFYSWWLLTAHRVSLNDYRSETLDRGENSPHNATWFLPFLVKRGARWHGAAKPWWWTAAARLWKSFHLQLLLYARVEKRISNADKITKNYRQRLGMNNNQISRKELINLIVFDKISLGNGSSPWYSEVWKLFYTFNVPPDLSLKLTTSFAQNLHTIWNLSEFTRAEKPSEFTLITERVIFRHVVRFIK